MNDISESNQRRRFLQALASASAALLGSSALRAAEPIAGRTSPKFKLSLAAYSYRSLLTSKSGEPEMELADFIGECAAMQLEGTELTSYYMPADPSPEYLIGLRSKAFELGLAVSGTAIRNDFGYSAGEKRNAELNHVRKWIDYAALLHAPMIRIFAGKVKAGTSQDEAHRLMVDGMKEVCDYAGKRGIYLALENHGGPTASAEGLLKIVKDVDSRWLGVNLDTGNFREGGDPYKQMEMAAPYAVNVQVKVVLHIDEQKQPMDFARVRDILQAANYRGFVVLEYEESGDVRAECRRYTGIFKETFA